MKNVFWGLLLAAALCGCRKNEIEIADDYIYPPVTNACRFIERLERAGAASNDVSVLQLDVRGLDARAFRRQLSSWPGRQVHVWMPGRYVWLLVAHATTNRVSLAAALDALALEENCESMTGLFANYVGTREEVMPAFDAKLQGEVMPEWFITKEIPTIAWLDARGVDGDILKNTLAEIRSMQVIRRLVMEGDLLSHTVTDKKSEEKAIDCWNRAATRNPHDLFICERLDRLERNARGFLAVGKILQAMKCYETMVEIHATPASVHNFGMCLKKIGKLDLAEKILKRAEELSAHLQQNGDI